MPRVGQAAGDCRTTAPRQLPGQFQCRYGARRFDRDVDAARDRRSELRHDIRVVGTESPRRTQRQRQFQLLGQHVDRHHFACAGRQCAEHRRESYAAETDHCDRLSKTHLR